jgi:hypothetical protein
MNARDSISVGALLGEIRFRQRRLGTAAERSEDFAEICELAHRLNNLRTAAGLMRDLRIGEAELATLLADHRCTP